MSSRLISAVIGLFLLGIGPASAQFMTPPKAPTQQSTTVEAPSSDCSQAVSLCDFGK